MPFCPECLQEQQEDLARCPLDRAFYVEVRCRGCGAEVLPRERFCVGCGRSTEGLPRQQVKALERAGRGRRLAAGVVDLLVLLLALEMARGSGFSQPSVLAGGLAVAAVLYGTLFQSGGRQTFGQALTGLMALTSKGTPLTLAAAAKRSSLQLLWWASLVLPLLDTADFASELSATSDYQVGA